MILDGVGIICEEDMIVRTTNKTNLIIIQYPFMMTNYNYYKSTNYNQL